MRFELLCFGSVYVMLSIFALVACQESVPETVPPREVPPEGSIAPETLRLLEVSSLSSWGATVVRLIVEGDGLYLIVTCSPDRIETVLEAYESRAHGRWSFERETTASESERVRSWVSEFRQTHNLEIPEPVPGGCGLYVEGLDAEAGYFCDPAADLNAESRPLVWEILQSRAKKTPKVEELSRLEERLRALVGDR